jgi:membrane protease YdiL (CAAX protease family)
MSVPPPSFQHPGSPPPRPELPEGVERPEPAHAGDGFPRWPLWAPFAGMLLTLVAAFVAVGVITVVAELAGADVDRPGDDLAPGVTIAATYAQDLALIASALLLARWLDGPVRAARFGFRPTPFGSALGWLVLTWVLFIAFSYVWSVALDIQETDDLPDELGAGGSTAALVAVALLVCVMAPIAEELFFRGFVFTAFRRSLGLPVAAVLTGAIFGAIHLGGTEIEFIVPLAVFGALLCLLYVWTDSLLPCIVLHALNNGLALGVAEDWGAWTPVAMLGAAALCLLITLPVVHRSRMVPT